MKSNIKPLHLFFLLLILTACKKEIVDPGADYAKVSFQNTSTELTEMLRKSEGQQKATILLDNPVVLNPDRDLHDQGIGLPFFDNGFTDHNNRNIYFYPNAHYNNGNEPWITYMRILAGHHQAGVSDTSKLKLAFSGINLEAGKSYSVFFTDSAGKYSLIQAKDEQKEVQHKIRIRVAHMSPSNDLICLSAGDSRQIGFAQGLHFKEVSDYQEFPLENAAEYSFRICKKGDPENVLGRAFILAVPGRSYTVIFKGYTRNMQYEDRFGQNISVGPNAELFIERSN